MKKHIILFFDSTLPTGTAGATRVISFAHIFSGAGFVVKLLGVNYNNANFLYGEYEGEKYELLDFPEIGCTGFSSWKRIAALKQRLEEWLDEYSSHNSVCCIMYTCRNGFARFFTKYSKKTGIPIVFNHVEWHLRSMFPGKMGLFSFLQNRMELIFYIKQNRNIIAISSFLENYYKKRGCNTLRIPTILDTSIYSTGEPEHSKGLILVYAGKPGKKDAIYNIIESMALLSSTERQQIEFRIFGVTKNEIVKGKVLSSKALKLIGNSVLCYGRIPYEQVQSEIVKADFTVLLREKTRNAEAGFPTKVGESMAAGVPVIANLTSDIGLYLHDGIEGLVCADATPQECARVLKKALSLTLREKKKMRAKARQCAEKNFDYRNYIKVLSDYLLTVEENRR